MAEPPRILIAGGYGVFGRLLARELLATTVAHLVLAGRDGARAAHACRDLGAPGRAEPLALDLADRAAVARAAARFRAVACAAGPFQGLPRDLPAIVVQAGADWLDIADYAGWVLPLLDDRALHAAATAAGRRVMPGLSSVPALSGALARWCLARRPDLARGHVTLYIGNRNHKGSAAIASALAAGVADPRPVDLPVGRHLAYRFDSPDAALLRGELGLIVDFRVAFEWDLSSRLLAALGPRARRLSEPARQRLAAGLAALAAPLSRFGSPLGCVQVDLWDAAGRAHARAAYVGVGQRLAILPCALAIQALLAAEPLPSGVVSPATWLPPDEWIARLARRGLRFQGEA
jgi:short subunit dehydrogenase-like uncharacterized protein